MLCPLYVDTCISYLAGQSSSAAINCPYVILGPYSFTVTANTVSTCDSPNSSWDMCTETSQMTFNRITCPDSIAFSGKLYRPMIIQCTTIIIFIYTSTTISKLWPLIPSMHLQSHLKVFCGSIVGINILISCISQYKTLYLHYV